MRATEHPHYWDPAVLYSSYSLIPIKAAWPGDLSSTDVLNLLHVPHLLGRVSRTFASFRLLENKPK